MAIDPQPQNRRKHPRFEVPKGIYAGWKSGGDSNYARVDALGLGGLYLKTLRPPPKDSIIDIIVGLPTGKLSVRAIVRRSLLGRGMGLEFIQLASTERARLNKYLLTLNTCFQPPKAKESLLFEQELQGLLELSEKGTYYQLLAVTPESSAQEIKKSYYALARKFHPDHHMNKGEVVGSLKTLMAVVTQAYNTLKDQQRRADYDAKLASSGTFNLERERTESRESVEEYLARANECLRAKNLAGSITWLRKCVERAPEEAKYRAMLARSLASVAVYRKEAIEHFQKAIELDPWNATAYFQFGNLYEEMQLPWRAQPLYAKALELNPDHVKAKERLARLDSVKTTNKSPSIISRVFG